MGNLMCSDPFLTLMVRAKNPDHVGVQSHRIRKGVGFLQSDPLYSVF
jgi:hypothetical protein